MEQPQRKKLKKNPSTTSDRNTLHYPLPLDIAVNILSYLQDVNDLGHCLLVNKFWNLAASQPSLWKKFVDKEFGAYFSHDGSCNWLKVYKNFHGLDIQEDSWVNIDDLEDTVSCPFCGIQLSPFEKDDDYYVHCDCNHQFSI
ncbi:unnamed protein product, partial [Didymodactylos carnosus]